MLREIEDGMREPSVRTGEIEVMTKYNPALINSGCSSDGNDELRRALTLGMHAGSRFKEITGQATTLEGSALFAAYLLSCISVVILE